MEYCRRIFTINHVDGLSSNILSSIGENISRRDQSQMNTRHEFYTGSDHPESNNTTFHMTLLALIRWLFSDYFCYAFSLSSMEIYLIHL
jgi:hypothetical protein